MDAPTETPPIEGDLPTPPPPAITAEEVRRIAHLAHLDVSDEEVARLTRELGQILAYVKQLDEVDLEGVPPTAHAALENPFTMGGDPPNPPLRLALRPDEPETSLPREVALREAPRVAMEGFAVPAFVDEG